MKRTVQQFANEFWPLAQATEEHGVPALLTLAQAALESGWGGSTPGNMFFGIKADPSWKGERQLLQTMEFIHGEWIKINAYFRKYPDARASFVDHADFLRQNGRYAKVFETPSEQVLANVKAKEAAVGITQEWLDAVAKADIAAYFVAHGGYATAPNYYDILQSQIRSFAATLGGFKLHASADHPAAEATAEVKAPDKEKKAAGKAPADV